MGDDHQTARERVVRDHMASEEQGDFAATLRTFARPRYEVAPTDEVHDGPASVRSFLEESGRAFPGFHFEDTTLHFAADAVIVETMFVGRHEGTWRGLPPTGRRVAYKMCNVFLFEGTGLVCERVHFDLLTVLRQIGIARDPTSLGGRIATFANHPLTIASAFARRALRR